MGKVISIDPITRLEGHGKIDIYLNDDGNVDKAFLQIPELRGFEKFVEGCRRLHHESAVSARRPTTWRQQKPLIPYIRLHRL